jgi:broad specificity phosphatase PhoE
VSLRRIVMLRHGETVGNSSVRFHGKGDVALSDAGRSQMQAAGRHLVGEVFDLVVASPLRRSWEGAGLVTGGCAPIRLENGFREIHFGRWEGLSAGEIEVRDPMLYREWQERAAGFEFPGGELRADFQARVMRAFERIATSGAASALFVGHKGVIRTLAEKLVGAPLADGAPELGTAVSLSLAPSGTWFLGRRSSNPAT